MTDNSEDLLRCLVQVVARAAIPRDQVVQIVGTGGKQAKAFNLCDGTRSQAEVAKKTGLHQASLSRTFARWVENGVAFWVGDGNEARLLHVYPVPGQPSRSGRKAGRSKWSRGR
jgi:hypothetical protein